MKFKDTECCCHPKVSQSVAVVSSGGFYSGHDAEDYSIKQARQILCKHFGAKAVFFTVGTTLANLLMMKQYLKEGGCVLAAHTSHLVINDSNAPAFFLNSSVFPVTVKEDGKLTVELLTATLDAMHGAGTPYQAVPEIVSITQPTESGSVYLPEELKALSKFCRTRGLRLHMDGARLAIAAAALNLPFTAITKDVGVSILSLGARKSIGGFGTALLFFENVDEETVLRRMATYRAIAEDTWRIAASFVALFVDDAALLAAVDANKKALQLREELAANKITSYCTGANTVWIKLTDLQRQHLQEAKVRYSMRFHQLGDRFTTSWDTSAAEISEICKVLRGNQNLRHISAMKQEDDKSLFRQN